MPVAARSDTLLTSRHEQAKKWLNKRLRKPASRQLLRSESSEGIKRKLSLKRPQTAPASNSTTPEEIPLVPQILIDMGPPSTQLAIQPPPRPPRPNTAVMRDVNAWLDSSGSVSPQPIMGGLSYWRSASAVPIAATSSMQYAVPIVRESSSSRSATPPRRQMKSLCRRRAKRVQAKLPPLLRTTSQRVATHPQNSGHSNSMPFISIAYEQTIRRASPKLMTRSKSFLLGSARKSSPKASTEEQELLTLDQSSPDVPVLGSTRVGATYNGIERGRVRETSGQAGRCSSRPTNSGTHLDESMGDLTLSEAPTYSSGLPPPSYRSRSRTASIVTTSSFGCVDGMSPAQRQISVQQQRVAMKNRGMRGRVKELRKLFENH
ncbi:hypothetical protein G6514_002275 [Epicoccum nigrum]|nr:hypothetical protein G6514_002275 [Epicoccum nigrum]